MNNLRLIALIFVSLLITSCQTDIKEPKTESVPENITNVWDSLPIDNNTDEDFFNSVSPNPPESPPEK